VHWSPNNQDHLVVSFADSAEIEIYDIASDLTPLPCIRINNVERVTKLLFLPSKSKNMRILTGGNRGGVRMWLIPTSIRQQQRPPGLNDFSSPQCKWSFTPLVGGEGVCDMLRLMPNDESLDPWPNKVAAMTGSHVLLAGDNATLLLLDVNKCTRKVFSTTVTPTVI
jgi:WD40 repeat protein